MCKCSNFRSLTTFKLKCIDCENCRNSGPWPHLLYLNKAESEQLSTAQASSCAGYSQVTPGSGKMPTFNLMPKEGLSLPRLSISVFMIIRLVLLCVDCVVIGIIGYYFAYYRGSYRQNLFHEELMVLVCATSAFINAAIFIVSSQYTYNLQFRQETT